MTSAKLVVTESRLQFRFVSLISIVGDDVWKSGDYILMLMVFGVIFVSALAFAFSLKDLIVVERC